MGNDLGERLINDAEELIKSGASLEDIREAMNAVYRHYKGELQCVGSSDKRLIKIFGLECLMEDRFLPLDSEPIYDPEDDVLFPESIRSEADCLQALGYIVHQTRKDLSRNYDIRTSSLEKHCIDTSAFVERLCDKHGVSYRAFSLDEDLSPGLFHCFDVVSFNVNGELKSYLVDCTYRQFFTCSQAFPERCGIPWFEGASIGAYMMMDEGRKEMAEELLAHGYIEFTEDVAKTYFDAMVFSGRNGLYYEGLGKSKLEKSDFEPQYTLEEYLTAITNGGLLDENIGRQRGSMNNPTIQFDSEEAMPYLSRTVEQTNNNSNKK